MPSTAPRSLAPDHPGPPFFYGLALAQGGNYDEAERIWRRLHRQRAGGRATIRRLIEAQLEALQQARARGAAAALGGRLERQAERLGDRLRGGSCRRRR